ncbi:hypothetical protein MKX03_031555 [Papaver bracteatum]|nr:hypothetical protein MKX03_031555 [Papaver bracteatum]
MVDMFDVVGIIQFGIAGNANSSLSIGDIGFITEELFYESGRVIQGMKLERCLNSSLCLPTKPKVVVGLRGEYLFNAFGVSSVEMESVAVVMTSICSMLFILSFISFTSVSNGLPVIVFQGLSDLAGGQQGQNAINVFGPLAALNAAKAVI